MTLPFAAMPLEAAPRFFMYEGPIYDPSAEVLAMVAETIHGPDDANGRAEFYGEALLYWELRGHPLRTRDASTASLFVLPSLPHLDPVGTRRAAAGLAAEPTWQRRRGADHMVMCTHWQCAGELGALFEMVALPGLIAALERNMMWLDPRVPHWFNNRTEQTKFDFGTSRGLCLDRVIVLPYPPHTSLMRHCGSEHSYAPWSQRGVNMSFYGTLRVKRGIGDSSDGVRTALVKLVRGAGAITVEELTKRGLDLRLFKSNEYEPSERCGPGLAIECRPLVGDKGKLKGREYARAMRNSIFCLHLRGDTSTSRRLSDSVAAGCIPIVVSDYIGPNLPFIFGEGEPPLRPPRVRYEDWSIRIGEADFIDDPAAAITAVLDRFLRPGADGGAPMVEQMQAAMMRDSATLLFCRGRSNGAGEAPDYRLADQVLGEAFARVGDRCGNCTGRAPTIAYRARRLRVRHAFKYRDCLGQHEAAGKWAWGKTDGNDATPPVEERGRLSHHKLDHTFNVS